jgi:integrase
LDTAQGPAPIDKRDLAIMTLAAQSGLRGGDIVKLKRSDIDWRANEVRVTQSKTGKPITLPLEPEAGNAIADWLLTCRQPDDGPYLFTVCLGPPRPLSPRGVSGVVARRMRQAGVSAAIPRRGAHSFRRGLGTRMLEAEIPIDMLSQVLGVCDRMFLAGLIVGKLPLSAGSFFQFHHDRLVV